MAEKTKGKAKATAKKNKRKKANTPKKPRASVMTAAVSLVLIIAVVISVIVIANSNNGSKGASQYDFGKKVADGVDVSEHNGNVDWDKLAKSQDFAFIRVGYRGYGNGEIVEDKRARENLKAANKAGIPVGVYFYTQAITEAEAVEEAKFVLNLVKHYDISLPVVIDFEYPDDENATRVGRLCESGLSRSEKTKIIKAFCDYVEKKEYASGVYASSSVFNFDIDTKKLGENTLIWVADYNKKVTYNVKYTVWQYSKTGKLDGNSSEYIDLNYWYVN